MTRAVNQDELLLTEIAERVAAASPVASQLAFASAIAHDLKAEFGHMSFAELQTAVSSYCTTKKVS